jgi:hypothetical protein
LRELAFEETRFGGNLLARNLLSRNSLFDIVLMFFAIFFIRLPTAVNWDDGWNTKFGGNALFTAQSVMNFAQNSFNLRQSLTTTIELNEIEFIYRQGQSWSPIENDL